MIVYVFDQEGRILRWNHNFETVAGYTSEDGQKDQNTVAALMERILAMIDRPFDIEGHRFFISGSIELSFYPRDGRDADTLLRNADEAMFRAKERGATTSSSTRRR